MENLKFKLEEKIYLTELKRPGRIKSVLMTKRGIQYEVRYFDQAKAHSEYFYEDEIETKPDGISTPF